MTEDQAKEIIMLLNAIGFVVTLIAVHVVVYVLFALVPPIRRYLARWWPWFA